MAGIIDANNGLAYAIASLALTVLYGWNLLAPFVACIALITVVVIYTHTAPALRQ